MAEKVCLDTDVCISIIKGKDYADNISDLIASGLVFVASITIFELFLRKENLEELKDFLDGIFVLDFNEHCAMKASDIYKELKSKGSLIEFRDIFIASAAITNNCSLATFNKKHFSKINGLKIFDKI